MALYHLRQIPLWGDYGNILMRGLEAKRDQSGALLLERVGPFAPPIMFGREALIGNIVLVTQGFKDKLLATNFGETLFKPTVKKHIVKLPWETWDRHAESAPKLPASG